MKNTIENRALLMGRLAEQRIVRDHYMGQSAQVDPHKEWHRFAELRELAARAEDSIDILKGQLDDLSAGRSWWACFRRDFMGLFGDRS